MLLLIVKKTV